MKAYIGTSGWQGKPWNATFFPKEVKKKDWLKYLATQFSSVEVNTTFYNMLKVETFEKWYHEVPKDFLFTLKFSQVFTHFKRLTFSKPELKLLKDFIKNSSALGKKFGPILIQLPPNFVKNLDKLEFLFTEMRKIEKKNKLKLRLAVEFRHASWFEDEVYDFMKKHKVAIVITNSPKWPSKIIRTADFVYMRFHGRDKSFKENYTKQELRKWYKTLTELKPKEVFAYFNEDESAQAANNALYLKSLFEK